jgi:hypothetical protein
MKNTTSANDSQYVSKKELYTVVIIISALLMMIGSLAGEGGFERGFITIVPACLMVYSSYKIHASKSKV